MIMEMEEVYAQLRELLYQKKIEPIKALRADLQNRADKILSFSRPVVDRFKDEPNAELPVSHETLVNYLEEFRDIRSSLAQRLKKKKCPSLDEGGDQVLMIGEVDAEVGSLQTETQKVLLSLNTQLAKPVLPQVPEFSKKSFPKLPGTEPSEK